MRGMLLVLELLVMLGFGALAVTQDAESYSSAADPVPLYVYPWPDPCCVFGTYWACVPRWDPREGLVNPYCKINWFYCCPWNPDLCGWLGGCVYYEGVEVCLGPC